MFIFSNNKYFDILLTVACPLSLYALDMSHCLLRITANSIIFFMILQF